MSTVQYEYDQSELLRRASAHPVAGPILQVIVRDLIIESLQQRLGEGAPEGEEKPPAGPAKRQPRKRAAAGQGKAPAAD